MNTDAENQLDLELANPPISEQEKNTYDTAIDELVLLVHSLLDRIEKLEAKTARM